jgi:hypothetical protein
MHACTHCSGRVERSFRYCPWCAAPQRLKLTEFFRPHVGVEGGAGRMLRVSRYLGGTEHERHVRFSVWDESGVAEAAISLDEGEARRLASFLRDPAPRRTRARRRLERAT